MTRDVKGYAPIATTERRSAIGTPAVAPSDESVLVAGLLFDPTPAHKAL